MFAWFFFSFLPKAGILGCLRHSPPQPKQISMTSGWASHVRTRQDTPLTRTWEEQRLWWTWPVNLYECTCFLDMNVDEMYFGGASAESERLSPVVKRWHRSCWDGSRHARETWAKKMFWYFALSLVRFLILWSFCFFGICPTLYSRFPRLPNFVSRVPMFPLISLTSTILQVSFAKLSLD